MPQPVAGVGKLTAMVPVVSYPVTPVALATQRKTGKAAAAAVPDDELIIRVNTTAWAARERLDMFVPYLLLCVTHYSQCYCSSISLIGRPGQCSKDQVTRPWY